MDAAATLSYLPPAACFFDISLTNCEASSGRAALSLYVARLPLRLELFFVLPQPFKVVEVLTVLVDEVSHALPERILRVKI